MSQSGIDDLYGSINRKVDDDAMQLVARTEEFLTEQPDVDEELVAAGAQRTDSRSEERMAEHVSANPELGECEIACAVTGLIYNKHLPRSPYIEQDPKTGEWKQSW